MARAIHSMIRVLNEERSKQFYHEAFGMTESGRFDFADFSLVYLANPESHVEVELTINNGRTEPYDLGDGYGHLAFSVEDLDAEHERFTNAGLNPRRLVDFKLDGTLVGRFFFVADPDGYEIEVLERSCRFTM